MPTRVLHLIDSGGLYGAEMILLDLAREQQGAGLHPVLLSAGTPDEGEKPLEAAARNMGIPVRAVRMKAGLNLFKALDVLDWAKAEGFDLLHSHGYKFNILLGLMPRIIRKLPLIATLHGYVGAPPWSRLMLYQLVDRLALHRLDGIVFVSGNMRNNPLLKGFRARNEATINNGIDLRKVRDGALDQDATSLQDVFPDDDDGKVYIGAIGRLSPEKGFELLLDVFARLHAREPRLRLVIIGEGEMRPQLERRIETLGLIGMARLPGFISPAYRLIAELDGVVMPSYTEGLPITLLEACILHNRIVASDVGSIAEVLSGYAAACVVQPGNGQALERAISDLIIDRVGSPVDTGGWNSERFGAPRMAEDYQRFYTEILAHEGRGSRRTEGA